MTPEEQIEALKEELKWAWENMTYILPSGKEGDEYDFCDVCNGPEYDHKSNCEALKHKKVVEETLGKTFWK